MPRNRAAPLPPDPLQSKASKTLPVTARFCPSGAAHIASGGPLL